jgi:hypothetical protein
LFVSLAMTAPAHAQSSGGASDLEPLAQAILDLLTGDVARIRALRFLNFELGEPTPVTTVTEISAVPAYCPIIWVVGGRKQSSISRGRSAL